MPGTKIKYIALGTDNKPLLNGVKKTLKGWKFYGNKFNNFKKINSETIVSIIPTWISLRDFEYVRANYGKIC